jgi:small subunit ribosomal protein S5
MVSKLVQRRRVARVTKGGRRFSVRVVVVLGDRSGRVGVGVGKAILLRKALSNAKKDAVGRVVKVRITDEGSIRHVTYGRFGAASVFLRPRDLGSGVVAGGSVRPVLEMAGVRNASSKQLGSRSPIGNARATIDALEGLAVGGRKG